MKVAELLQIRRRQWKELESLCDTIESRQRSCIGANTVSRFTSLYRAACADLALADENRLPQKHSKLPSSTRGSRPQSALS